MKTGTLPWLHALFLVSVLLTTSGYRFRCYFFCTDQTAVQDDYIEQRDRCRDYAQLKLDMAMRQAQANGETKDRKSMLVGLFSECMGNNGWTVPAGREEAKAGAPPVPGQAGPPLPWQTQPSTAAPGAPGAVPGGPATAPVMMATPSAAQAEEKAALSRQAECAFARHSASVSSNAKARAEACDLECAARLKASPEAPRPAACPSEPMGASDLSNGDEKAD